VKQTICFFFFLSVFHSLSYNDIGAEGCEAFAAALQTNATLTLLK
jgi:hypothetical protein